LEKRIEEFERRQVQDDAVNCIINRHWNMVHLHISYYLSIYFISLIFKLDGDIQLLLQRFDDASPQDGNKKLFVINFIMKKT
jgi:hypothetical protein